MGQNLAHASTAHALNLTCFDVYRLQYRNRVRYRVVFCFKKRDSLNLKPKTQALICLKAVVQQVNMFWQFFRLDMGKIGQIYEQLLPNMSEIGMFHCSEVDEQGLSQLLSCHYWPDTPDFGFEQE